MHFHIAFQISFEISLEAVSICIYDRLITLQHFNFIYLHHLQSDQFVLKVLIQPEKHLVSVWPHSVYPFFLTVSFLNMWLLVKKLIFLFVSFSSIAEMECICSYCCVLMLSPFNHSWKRPEISDHKESCKGRPEAFSSRLHSELIRGSGATLPDCEGLQVMSHNMAQSCMWCQVLQVTEFHRWLMPMFANGWPKFPEV